MPMHDSDARFTFVFDSHGRLRLENTEKSLEFLDMVDKNVDENKELQIVLGSSPIPPNMSLNCGEKPIGPNRVTGCLNDICPVGIKLKLEKLIQDEWNEIIDGRIGGPA